MKAISEIDIKKVLNIIENISKIEDIDIDSDIVFSELQLFDKMTKGDYRRQLLDLVKNTIIKHLYIPNTTYIDEEYKNEPVLPSVFHLKLVQNFLKPDINIPKCTFQVFPNIKVLDIEQILMTPESRQLITEFVNSYDTPLEKIILNWKDDQGHSFIAGISVDRIKLVTNLDDEKLKLGNLLEDLKYEIANNLEKQTSPENTEAYDRLLELEEKAKKDQDDLTCSQLRGIDFNFTSLGETRSAIKTCWFLPNLKYLKIQRIEVQRLKNWLWHIFSWQFNLEELELQTQADYGSKYPKNSLNIVKHDLSKNELKMLVEGTLGSFSVSANEVRLSFDWNLIEAKDWKNEGEIWFEECESISTIYLRQITYGNDDQSMIADQISIEDE